MIGRISTAETYRSSITSVTNAQNFLTELQEKLATGKKVLQPSDDPVSAAQIESLKTDLRRLESYEINTTRAEAQLAFSEDTLSGVEGVLNRARELTLQAQNPALSVKNRQTIGTEINGLLEQMVNLGNTQSADGEYIFGGLTSKTQPYELTAGGVTSANPSGNRSTNIAPGLTVQTTDAGTDVFNATPGNGGFTIYADAANTGNGVVGTTRADTAFDSTQDYTLSFQTGAAGELEWVVTDGGGGTTIGTYKSGDAITFDGGNASITVKGTPAVTDSFDITGNNSAAPVPTARTQSAFDTLVEVRDALLNSDGTEATKAIADTVLSQALDHIDQGLDQVALVRTDIGVRMNRIDAQRDLNSSFDVQLRSVLSELEDLDYADAISQLSLQLTALQAAQQTFVKTSGVTLFNYL